MLTTFILTLLAFASCLGKEVQVEDDHLYAYLVGCFNDKADDRDLPEIANLQSNLTISLCFHKCRARLFKYAGVQNGELCFCSDSYGHHGNAVDSDCKTPCNGDRNSHCGGPLKNLVYETGKIKTLDQYQLGCFKVNKNNPELPRRHRSGSRTTKHFCFNHCRRRNFKFSAAGFKVCYCGDTFASSDKLADTECNIPCAGDRRETCGGYNKMEVFKTDQVKRPDVRADVPRLGCFTYKEDNDLPILTYKAGANTTKHLCLDHCKNHGFKYAGVRAGDTCSCSDIYGYHGKAADNECNVTCLGDSGATCGGKDREDVYATGVNKTIASRFLGCFNAQDNTTAQNDLQDMSISADVVAHHFCLLHCKKSKFKYAGVQAGRICTCGDTYGRYGKVADAECSDPCAGDAGEKCGGALKNYIFESGYKNEKNESRVGCFKIQNLTELVTLYSKNLPSAMTRIICFKFCKAITKYKYAYLVSGNFCYCDKDHNKLTKTLDTECNKPCSGDAGETCGGQTRSIQEVFSLENTQEA